MENKQTAIGLFAIKTLIIQLQLKEKNISPEMYELEYFKLLKEAKQMEKKQIMDAFECGKSQEMILDEIDSEDYYNKTYGK